MEELYYSSLYEAWIYSDKVEYSTRYNTLNKITTNNNRYGHPFHIYP
jgi:hypothetical protein